MLRWLLAVMLVSCGAPTSVTTTPPPTAATRSAAVATTSPTPSARSSPTPEPTGLATCAASQLQAVAAGTMATDFYVGAVFFANRGTAPCTLRGNPEVLLLASDGSFVDLGGKPLARFGAPPCDDASGPSTLVVYPFQEPVR